MGYCNTPGRSRSGRVRFQQRRHRGAAGEVPGLAGAAQQNGEWARSRLRNDCVHGVLLRKRKGNALSRWGTWGSPFGTCRRQRRQGSAPVGRQARDGGPCSREQGLRSMPRNPKAGSSNLRSTRRSNGHSAVMAGPGSSRASSEGRYRLRRQRSWTSGRPEPPLKAVRTRCPRKRLQYRAACCGAQGQVGRCHPQAPEAAGGGWWWREGGGEVDRISLPFRWSFRPWRTGVAAIRAAVARVALMFDAVRLPARLDSRFSQAFFESAYRSNAIASPAPTPSTCRIDRGRVSRSAIDGLLAITPPRGRSSASSGP